MEDEGKTKIPNLGDEVYIRTVTFDILREFSQVCEEIQLKTKSSPNFKNLFTKLEEKKTFYY